MASILVSEMVRALFGASALALGTVGILSEFIFEGGKSESLRTVSHSLEDPEVVENLEEEAAPVKVTTPVVVKAKKQDVPAKAVAPIKKECRIHKLISSYWGTFQKVEKEMLRQEIAKSKRGDYSQIERTCKEVGDQDIFVSNKWWSPGWRYYKSDQNSSQFKNYLKRIDTTR
ncbi:hypothetical protein MHF_0679 [Mycoplasma haemofelis Ohio2]|uniref:Uncharacterized protein n=1 Tax=Mycoplasma haemofelis (strain Ohio2) TaxID=859194 RepID=F6FIA1_MYCHI|nr:hypothetical protein MHF_0679 [Mycoplasma haemofelis Ohio2]